MYEYVYEKVSYDFEKYVMGGVHVYIATQNVISTFLVGGHIFHSPILTKNFDTVSSNVYRSSVQYLMKWNTHATFNVHYIL